jgi:hypothetical protein
MQIYCIFFKTGHAHTTCFILASKAFTGMTDILLDDQAFIIHGLSIKVTAHNVVCFSMQLEMSFAEVVKI